jgi:putative transposase
MGISSVWVKKLWRRYRIYGSIPKLEKPGRKVVEPSKEEKDTILFAYNKYQSGAVLLERIIDVVYCIHIPHNRIHRVMRSLGIAKEEPRKHVRKKWIKYERKYSNSLWHTDWKYLEGYGWFTAYLDDASRYVTGYGLFNEATSEHSVEVLKRAVQRCGRPASILTDRGTQFYAVEAEERVKGLTVFEEHLIENEIRQIYSRVNHPQTNGKLERFFRTVEEKIDRFGGSIDDLIHWYNTKRPHMSLNLDVIETPYQAYLRKMPPREGILEDEESGEIYDVERKRKKA